MNIEVNRSMPLGQAKKARWLQEPACFSIKPQIQVHFQHVCLKVMPETPLAMHQVLAFKRHDRQVS